MLTGEFSFIAISARDIEFTSDLSVSVRLGVLWLGVLFLIICFVKT